MSKSNLDALFNPNVEVREAKTKNAGEYTISADKGQSGVYQSVIRFIPWHKDPQKGSIQDKWSCWLVDPVSQKGKLVDCPSSVGKHSIIFEMYSKLSKSENVTEKNKAEIFSRKHRFASLIQVIKDKQQPELEGKILVYQYGVKIYEKIMAELKPIIGEKQDPFDLLNGKMFGMIVTKVSKHNNYDQAKFLDKPMPLLIPDAQGKLKPISEQTDKQMVYKFIVENSPNLEAYGYREWDDVTTNYVNDVIAAVTGKANVSQNFAAVKNNTVGEKKSAITATNISLDDIGNDIPGLDNDFSSSDSGVGDIDDLLATL